MKGSFTRAVGYQEGLFQRARVGTIFLDEIGEMPLSLQPKLLRVLEEKTVLPVGSTTPVKVNARILAATNRELRTQIETAVSGTICIIASTCLKYRFHHCV